MDDKELKHKIHLCVIGEYSGSVEDNILGIVKSRERQARSEGRREMAEKVKMIAVEYSSNGTRKAISGDDFYDDITHEDIDQALAELEGGE